jgi:hypothetical protein
MALAGVYYLWRMKVISELLLAMALIIGLFGVAMTESKSGLLSAALMTAIIMGRFMVQREIKWTLLAAMPLGFLLLCWCLWPFIFQNYWANNAGEAFNRLSAANESIRLLMWSQIIEAIYIRPWFGWGAGNISEAVHSVAENYVLTAPFTFSHNIVLDLIVSYGFPVALFAMGSLVYWGRTCLLGPLTLVAKCSFLIMLPVAIHSFFEFPHAYAYFLLPVALLIGLVENQNVSNLEVAFSQKWEKLVIALSIFFFVIIAREYWLIEEDFRIARFEYMKIGATERDYVAPSPFVLTHLGEVISILRIKPEPHMEESQIRRVERISIHYPWLAIQNKYAQIVFLNGDLEAAKAQLRLIKRMHGQQTYEAIKAGWLKLGEQQHVDVTTLFNE